jgi:hypothetical protein
VDYDSLLNEARTNAEQSETGGDFRVSFESEEWRPVVGFECFYEVSSSGRIRSLSRTIRSSFGAMRRHEGRLLTPCLDRDGYPKIMLRVAGKHRTFFLHRLVADAFHGHKRNALHSQVDHIDNNRANARAENLRWVSMGENHFRRRGSRRAQKASLSVLTEDQVREIRSAPKERGSVSKLARKFGVPYWSVYDAKRRRTWRHV